LGGGKEAVEVHPGKKQEDEGPQSEFTNQKQVHGDLFLSKGRRKNKKKRSGGELGREPEQRLKK